MKQLKKTLLTLVALLAVTTGAWADDKKVVLKVDPITVANGSEAEIKVKMDYTAEKTLVGLSFSLYLPDGILLKGFNTKEAQDAARASALMKAFDLDVTTGLWGNEEGASGWFYVKKQVDGGLQITLIDQDGETPFVNTHAPVITINVHAVADVANVNGTINGITLTDNENNSVEQGNIADVLIPFNATAQEPESAVAISWDNATKTATLTNGMPAGNVTVTAEYFPQAALTEAPTAINDVPATTDGAIVKVGTVANIGSTETAQGTVMYYVSQTALDDDALLALDADKWKADVPTAESLAEGQAYVYYYVRGNDSDTDEENFSDGDILAANALNVTIAAEPTYAVTFADGVNPEPPAEPEWTASPNTDVKKGQTVTVTYTGTRKVIGVKAEKKAEAATPTLAEATAEDYGKVVCAAGHLHDAKTAVPDGCTAVGILGMVTSTGHGLILALKDAAQQNWNTINGWTSASYAGTTLKVLPDDAARGGTNLTSYTTLGATAVSNWAVAQLYDYKAIFTNLESTNEGIFGKTYDGNVNAYITGVGGAAISGDYWSTSEDEDESKAWYFGSEILGYDSKSTSYNVRPVLGF